MPCLARLAMRYVGDHGDVLAGVERLFQGDQGLAPPLSRCRLLSRPPEPRTASMPNFSTTMALSSASALRDTMATSARLLG